MTLCSVGFSLRTTLTQAKAYATETIAGDTKQSKWLPYFLLVPNLPKIPKRSF